MSPNARLQASAKVVAARITFLAIIFAVIFVLAFIAYDGYSRPQPIYSVPGKFLIEPYLQLGRTGDVGDMEIVWATDDKTAKWQLSTSSAPGLWLAADQLSLDQVAIDGVPSFLLYHARLKNILPGLPLTYSIKKENEVAFESKIQAPPLPLESVRMIISGDVANHSRATSAVAKAIHAAKPNIVLIAGDIVYQHGTLSEYFNNFFPVLNAADQDLLGAPLLRTTLCVAAPGNHDTAHGSNGDTRNLNRFPDGLAYYILWKQPLNGPQLKFPGPNIPTPTGSDINRDNFLRAAGESYPGMGMFSFNYANAHWTVLDSNEYVDWENKDLRRWVEQDILKAKDTKWHFVIFHHPAFNSDYHHGNEQRMRVMADVFQKSGVDIVFAGHVHNYQRTYPLSFTPATKVNHMLANGTVPGKVKIDKTFDGVKNTKAKAPIYIITGCGGADLTGKRNAARRELWEPFTAQFFSVHSYSQCDIRGSKLVFQQIDTSGKILDKFELTK